MAASIYDYINPSNQSSAASVQTTDTLTIDHSGQLFQATPGQIAAGAYAPITAIQNGTSTDAGPLTGAEFVTLSRGTGNILQSSISNIGEWILRNLQPFKYAGASVGTVAAGTTIYLGCNQAQTQELDTGILIDQTAVVTQIMVVASTAPGTSQSFTFALNKNGVSTAMTGQLSGSSTQLIISANTQAVASGDYISLKLVTSSGAALSRFRYSITVIV